jgi:hypothetical protein
VGYTYAVCFLFSTYEFVGEFSMSYTKNASNVSENSMARKSVL